MAIICLGEVMAQGHPKDLLNEIQGKVWQKLINRQEIEQYRNKTDYKVISTHLHEGKTQIHVVADAKPDASFEPIEANLEDVYFATISKKVDTITI